MKFSFKTKYEFGDGHGKVHFVTDVTSFFPSIHNQEEDRLLTLG